MACPGSCFGKPWHLGLARGALSAAEADILERALETREAGR